MTDAPERAIIALMETTRLGRTGLRVSRLCLGTMNFGPEASEQDSHRMMDRALDAGMFFFDTADMYGYKFGQWDTLPREGPTEQIIGRWLAQGGGRRDRIVLATKVYGQMWEGANGRGLSAYHVRRACEESLRRLRTDHLDLYQMHHVDRDTPWDEVWQAMQLLVQQGKVLYVGSSNFAAWHIAQANEAAARRGVVGLVSEQSLYNLAARTVELEVIPACRAYGVGILPWSPLGGGLLGGALEKVSAGRRATPRMQERIRAAPRHPRAVGAPLQGARAAPRGRGARVGSPAPRRHRPDRRAAHAGAARAGAPRGRAEARRPNAGGD